VGAVINRFPEQSGRVPKFQDLAIIGVSAAVISAAAQLFLTRDHLYEIAMISRFGCLTSKDVCALPYNFHRARFPLQNNSHFVLSIMQSHSTTSGDILPINQDVSLSPSNSVANLNSTARGEAPIVTLLERLPPIETVPPPNRMEASSSSAVSQQAPPLVRYSHAEAPSHPDGPFMARSNMFPNGGDPRADTSAQYVVDKYGKGHYSAWCILHQHRRNEDALIQRLPDGFFVCKTTHQCKQKWCDSRTPQHQTSGSTTRGDYRSSAQHNPQQGPVFTPSAQSAGSSHQGQVSSTPSAQTAGNPQQGQVLSTPSAQSQGGDLWSAWKPRHQSYAAQGSLIELGSSFERGSTSTPQVTQNRVSPPIELGSTISSQVTQYSVSPPIELGSVSSVLAPQAGPVATLSSVFSSPVSLAPLELSPSASAEVTSPCIYRDVRLNLALMAELDASQ